MGRFLASAAAAALAGLALAGGASAAQLIDRNATGVRIAVNTKGEALLTYRKGGAVKHVLVWGAVNALPSRAGSMGSRQARFRLDYAGGWGKYRTLYWKRFRGSCGTYDGPVLPDVVAACTAPDGSYWAAQSWPQPLPDLGFTPWNAARRADWLEVSHWTGPVAQIETGMDWVYNGRFQDLFGRYTYRGMPVYGYGTTRYGAPTDGFGALIYLDTYDSVYGPGWQRENSFVSHNPPERSATASPLRPDQGRIRASARPDRDPRARDGHAVPPLRRGPRRDPRRRRDRAGTTPLRPAQPTRRRAPTGRISQTRLLRRPLVPRRTLEGPAKPRGAAAMISLSASPVPRRSRSSLVLPIRQAWSSWSRFNTRTAASTKPSTMTKPSTTLRSGWSRGQSPRCTDTGGASSGSSTSPTAHTCPPRSLHGSSAAQLQTSCTPPASPHSDLLPSALCTSQRHAGGVRCRDGSTALVDRRWPRRSY